MLEIPGAALCIVFDQKVTVWPSSFPFMCCFTVDCCNGGNSKITKAARKHFSYQSASFRYYFCLVEIVSLLRCQIFLSLELLSFFAPTGYTHGALWLTLQYLKIQYPIRTRTLPLAGGNWAWFLVGSPGVLRFMKGSCYIHVDSTVSLCLCQCSSQSSKHW